MTHPCHIIYTAATGVAVAIEPAREWCALCGQPAVNPDAPHPRLLKDAVSDNFTDLSALRVPHSPQLCPACWYCLREEYLRRSTFYAQTDPPLLERLEGTGMRARVYDRLMAEHWPDTDGAWLLACIEPGVQAKHISFKCRVNYGHSSECWVQLKDVTLTIARAVFRRAGQAIEAMLALGISKNEAITGQYWSYKLAKLTGQQARDWEAAERTLHRLRVTGTHALMLAEYCAPASLKPAEVSAQPQPQPQPQEEEEEASGTLENGMQRLL